MAVRLIFVSTSTYLHSSVSLVSSSVPPLVVWVSRVPVSLVSFFSLFGISSGFYVAVVFRLFISLSVVVSADNGPLGPANRSNNVVIHKRLRTVTHTPK